MRKRPHTPFHICISLFTTSHVNGANFHHVGAAKINDVTPNASLKRNHFPYNSGRTLIVVNKMRIHFISPCFQQNKRIDDAHGKDLLPAVNGGANKLREPNFVNVRERQK